MQSFESIQKRRVRMSRFQAIFPIVIALLAPSTVSFAQEAPSATIAFSGGSVAAGVGYTWGSGTLLFKGEPYPFKVSGLSVIDIGVDRIDGTGTVYNLKNPADAAGTYFAAGAGATVAGGGSVAVLENQNGVIVHFHSKTAGLKLNLAASGIVVKLK
jgi:hypothetical protein